jgi:hypothetical protein
MLILFDIPIVSALLPSGNSPIASGLPSGNRPVNPPRAITSGSFPTKIKC